MDGRTPWKPLPGDEICERQGLSVHGAIPPFS